jgi:eukaryotic-like serine/threonine-protein kinase
MSMPAADRLVAGRYALKAPLGRGGMGVVWRAQDAVLGREVAVKEVVFPPAMADDERRPAQARVMREARAAARLNHPGAVTLYDVIRDDGGTFIVMELVDGPTLADLVRADGPLPPERVAELAAQLVGALEAAHAVGIVHRDVKPGNVMVPEQGMVKLADFGVASLQGDPQLTSTGLVIGSPAYMAPEQAKGEESGPPADFWALGATMFYAVEGEPPFDRGTSIATLAAVVNEPPRDLRRAGALAPLITALLAKDPGSRPSGPKVRAWLEWLLIVAPSARPAEALPVDGPARTVPLPPAGAVDNREHPTPPSATLPLRGPPHAEVGPAAAGAEAARDSEAGVAPAGAAEIEDPEVEISSAGAAASDDPEVEAPRAGPVAAGVEDAEDPPAGARGPDPVREPPRPLLPPAPVIDRGGRDRKAGVIALLVVLGLAAVLLAVNLRLGGGEPTATSETTAAGAGGASGTTRQGASTTGATGTTRAPTTTAAAGGLPDGWTSFTNQRGASRVGVPPGFRARTRERFNATVVEERHGDRRVFTVRSQDPSAQLPQASRAYRAGAPRRFSGFHEVSYREDQTYAGHQGAVVFEYEAVVDGRRVHVSHINFKGRTWGYNVEYIVPADRWDASQGLARQFEQAFQALG